MHRTRILQLFRAGRECLKEASACSTRPIACRHWTLHGCGISCAFTWHWVTRLKQLYRVRRQLQKAPRLDVKDRTLQAREVNLRRSQVKRSALDPMAHFAHGNSLETAGDLFGAHQAHERALALRPDFGGGGINLGALYVGEGWLEETAAAFQKVLKADPDRVEAMNNLGLIDREWGRLEEARELYLKVLERRPNLAQAHFNLAPV